MKKIFFFAAIMLAAISMNAEQAVFDYKNKVGTATLSGSTVEETVKVHGTSTDCISLKNSFIDKGAPTENYVEIAPASGNFQIGDIVRVVFCLNNSDASKTGVLGIYDVDGTELTYAAANNTYSSDADPSEWQYELIAEKAKIRFGRKSGNTKVCITELQVIRGGEVIPVAAKPVFSVGGGTYFEPFKVAVESSNADKIFVSVNNGIYEEYTDSILIDQYDVDYTLSAYATLEGAEKNSDTATVTYKLKHFVARPVFNARVVYEFAGVKADDINILSGTNATKGTYKMDGVDCPSLSYINMNNVEAGRDSFMIFQVMDKENVTFRYKNGNNKADIFKFAADFMQCDGSNGEIWIDNVKSGDTIVFVVTAKGSAPEFTVDASFSKACYLDPYQPDDENDLCFTDGIVMTASTAKVENNYSGWTDLVYTVAHGGHSKVRIKEIKNGYRLAKILVGAYRGVEAVDNVNAIVKAIKTIENGQLVIIKNGVRYNALGAQL